MTFTPTPEQLRIIDAAVTTNDNMLITALAGAAKTSTLVLIATALRKKEILCIAFNKRIAEEMAERLPPNCKSSTLNSLGHRAWASYLGTRLNLDTKKTHRIVTDIVKGLKGEHQDWGWENLSDLMRCVDFGKTAGFIPTGHFSNAKPLMETDEYFAHLDEEMNKLAQDIVVEASIRSLREAMLGTIDFNDQLLMPTVFPAVFDFTPVVMVDEAQDLSALNHAMLRKVAKKRLIAVGDAFQAIYGFRGAHEDSMELLWASFNMTKYSLTVSFRCPVAVVEEARWRAPMMQWAQGAKPGLVARKGNWEITDLPDDNLAIICRNNAPLFSMAIRLLRDGRYPELVGNDIGKTLIKILKKLGEPSMKREDALQAIREWEEEKLLKARNEDRVRDQAACLRVFVEEADTLGKAIDYAERVMEVAGPIKLMTGHKSKGLEFNTVFILDKHLLRTKESDNGQDRNLLYVMQTRSKNELFYVDSEHYFSEHDA